MGFPRQDYWSGFPFPPPGDLHNPRDWTQVSHIACRFFTVWATTEAQEYWSGQPIPSPGDFPTQELNQGLLHCRWILYQLSYQGKPYSSILPAKSWQPLIFLLSLLPLPECHSVGIIPNVTFSDRFLSLSNKRLHSLHDLTVHHFLVLNNYLPVWMYYSLFTHSPTGRHLHCLQILTIMNTAAINIMFGFFVGT